VFDRLNSVARFLDTIGDPPGTLDESYSPPRVVIWRTDKEFCALKSTPRHVPLNRDFKHPGKA